MSNEHSDDHNPIKTPTQFAVTVLLSFILPVFVIIGLVYYVTSENKTAAGSDAIENTAQTRIEKVAHAEVRDANRVMKTGEEVFKAQCTTCHSIGAAGAPKFGDASAWGPRIGKGFAALLNSALHGKGAMAPQGGGDFDDFEVARAVVYMANAGGAKFPEPTQAAK